MSRLHALSPKGLAALATTVGQRTLLGFDFDGTLAPLVARPEAAHVAPGMSRLLAELAVRLPLAIVTGRDAVDVQQRLGFVPHAIVGNHGAEDATLQPPSDRLVQALRQARLHLHQYRELLQRSGVTVEDKRYSLCLHYRLAQDRSVARHAVAQVLAGLGPELRAFAGKLGVNIVAAQAPDKFDAVQALVQRAACSAALYVGDDVNDEPVFARAPTHWMTIRVGRTPRDSQARFYLDSTREVALLLVRILALLR